MPKFRALKAAFAKLGCTIEVRQPPRDHAFTDYEGLVPERPHPPRLVSPRGGFVSDIDDYPDDEDVSPSIFNFLCRSLGFKPSEVQADGPDGAVTTRLPVKKVVQFAPTRADGGVTRRRKR